MKRRSVTFADSPPDNIDNNKNGCICAPLSTSNIFLWIKLAKVKGRQRKNASETQHKWWQHHYFRAIPDLNKQQYYLSVESKSAKLHFNNNRGKNVFQQEQRMDPIYLSMPDLGIAVRRRLLRATVESVGNVTKTDTAWNLHRLRRTGWGEKLLLRRSESVSDYFLRRHETTAKTATGSPVKDIIDAVLESSAKNSVDHYVNTRDDHCIDDNDNTFDSRRVTQQHRSSLKNGRDSKKNDVISGVSDTIVHRNYTHENRNDSDINNDVENRNDRVSKSNNDYGKLVNRSLQRYHYNHLDGYKKFHFVMTGRNWFWKNIAVNNSNAISIRCYSLLNKPLKQKNFATNSMRNSISKQCYYYPSMIYLKSQQQLVDGNFFSNSA